MARRRLAHQLDQMAVRWLIDLGILRAITVNALTGSSDTTNQAAYPTASVAPAAQRAVILSVSAPRSAGDPGTPTISGIGLTWNQEVSYLYDSSGAQARIMLWWADSGASPSSGVITITFPQAVDGCCWSVFELDGADLADPIVQTATNNGNSNTLTVTLGSFGDAGNGTFGAFAKQNQDAFTEGSGFTEMHDVNHATPGHSLQTIWRADNDTSVDSSWTNAAPMGGLAAELRAAAAGQPFWMRLQGLATVGRDRPGRWN